MTERSPRGRGPVARAAPAVSAKRRQGAVLRPLLGEDPELVLWELGVTAAQELRLAAEPLQSARGATPAFSLRMDFPHGWR